LSKDRGRFRPRIEVPGLDVRENTVTFIPGFITVDPTDSSNPASESCTSSDSDGSNFLAVALDTVGTARISRL
jgi:hypothetical protein